MSTQTNSPEDPVTVCARKRRRRTPSPNVTKKGRNLFPSNNGNTSTNSENLTSSQKLMPPPSTPIRQPFAEISNGTSPSEILAMLEPIGYSSPSPSSHPSSSRLSSSDSSPASRRVSTEEVPGGTHLNGVCEELEYDYDEQTEAWKWFQQSLEEESQPWKPRNIPHVCYALFAEKDLEEFQDRIKGCDLTETDVNQFIRDYMKYIGETSDIRSRLCSHSKNSKFKGEMVAENWVLVSLSPNLHFNLGKGKDMEAALLQLAQHFGLFNTREKSGYGIYNSSPGLTSTTFYEDILADVSHEHHEKFLRVWRDVVLWGIKFGKKLYLSKQTIMSSPYILEHARLHDDRQKKLERQAKWRNDNPENEEEQVAKGGSAGVGINTPEFDHESATKNEDHIQAFKSRLEYRGRRNLAQLSRRAGTPVPRPPLTAMKCGACGKHGHNRSNSWLCTFHPAYIPIA